ncbi:MAG TPA: LLM class flavin-dependent oxidoreductase [Pseudolabrys sp.]|nr:LLM class flavin-dependent oxidoreductase [Pseudolabrys sp.]
MTKLRRQIHLGLFAFPAGNHAGGWRHPDADNIETGVDAFVQMAKTAERGLFDLFFLSDGLHFDTISWNTSASIIDPVVLQTAVALNTTHIGLAATASTTYSDPYNLARRFLSLDHVSKGRAAWNIVTTGGIKAAANFGLAEHPPHDARYTRAREFVDVVKGLWNSLPAEALIRDRAGGVYVDPARVHVLDHKGPEFSVRGPLNLSRSGQGYPVLIQAGASEPGKAFAASVAELVFTAQQTLEEGQAFYAEIGVRARAAGRRESDRPLILPGVMPIIGSTEVEAQALHRSLQERVNTKDALAHLTFRFGHDFSGYSLDDKLPELSFDKFEGNRSRAVLVYDYGRRNSLSLREVFSISAEARGHRIVIGTPEQIADDFATWFNERGADGFNVMPPFFNKQFEIFVDEVVPILQRRGLYRAAYEAQTLRGHFGLPVPPPADEAAPAIARVS